MILLNSEKRYLIDSEMQTLLSQLNEAAPSINDKSKKEPSDAKSDKSGGDKNPFKPEKADSNSADAPPSGGDNPFSSGGESSDATSDTPSGDGNKEDSENKITFYNEKLNSQKIIKNQKIDEEPNFDFNVGANKFYIDNYTSIDKNGSLLIASPKIQNIHDAEESDLKFIKNVVLKKIDSTVVNALKRYKRVVMLGDYGLPYYNGKYENDEQGLVAKYLNERYTDNYIIYDSWIPSDYYSFIGNTHIWSDLKERTETKNLDIKTALYLYLEVTGRNKNLAKQLKSDRVKEKISLWGLNSESDDIKNYAEFIFPEAYGNEQTIASFIIKIYMQLLKVNLIKKVMAHENKNRIAIVVTDKNAAWSLCNSFKRMHEMIKEPPPETPPTQEPDAKSAPPKNQTVAKEPALTTSPAPTKQPVRK